MVRRDFNAERPNQLWCVDITQIRTQQGWLFAAVMIDAFSRKIISWATEDRHTNELPIEALKIALAARRPAPGGIVHSDRGYQFTSWAWLNAVKAAGLHPSMGRSALRSTTPSSSRGSHRSRTNRSILSPPYGPGPRPEKRSWRTSSSTTDDVCTRRSATTHPPTTNRVTSRCPSNRGKLNAHHIEHWPLGPTALHNLTLLCRRHHGAVHRHGWTVTLGDDGWTTWTSPGGTTRPGQRHGRTRAGP